MTFFAVALMSTNPIAAMDNAVSITKFESSPIIVFKPDSDVYLSRENWTILSYFDLRHFFSEIKGVSQSISDLENVCINYKILRCVEMVRRLKLESNDINSKADAFRVSTKRSRRAILNIVGNIASDLFGVLDSRFQENYVDDMSHIHKNEEHLLTLFKNQTSVVETTLNIVKKEQIEMRHQHNYLNDIAKNVTKLINDADNAQQLLLTALQISNELNRLSIMQTQLLESVVNSESSHINLNVISVSQLRDQFTIIRKYVDRELVVPEKNIYDVMRMVPFLTKNNIIFRLTIPLISIKKYQLFKIFKIPFNAHNRSLIATNIFPYLLTDLELKSYQLLSLETVRNYCKKYDEAVQICEKPTILLERHVRGCEWNLFMKKELSDACVMETNPIEEWFTEYATNEWLFSLKNESEFRTICHNSQINHYKLTGEGILTLKPRCQLDTGKTMLYTQKTHHSYINNTEVIQRANAFKINELQIKNSTFVPSLKEFREIEFKDLENRVQQIRESSIFTANIHDSHHYVLSYILLSSLIGIMYFVYSKIYKHLPEKKIFIMPEVAGAGECSEVNSDQP